MITQIYSLQTVQEAQDCVAAGVDYIGLASGTNANLPAELTLEEGKEIFDAVRGKIKCVSLVVADGPEEIYETVRYLQPDAVQVCGNVYMATPEFCREVKEICPGIEVIQAIGITGREAIPLAVEYGDHCDSLILDSVDPNIAGIGAAGFVNDWDVCAEIVKSTGCKVILAGGLGPDNVAEAIEKVRPWAVDSLTRTSRKNPDGSMEKDPALVRAFVENAKEAAKRLGL